MTAAAASSSPPPWPNARDLLAPGAWTSPAVAVVYAVDALRRAVAVASGDPLPPPSYATEGDAFQAAYAAMARAEAKAEAKAKRDRRKRNEANERAYWRAALRARAAAGRAGGEAAAPWLPYDLCIPPSPGSSFSSPSKPTNMRALVWWLRDVARPYATERGYMCGRWSTRTGWTATDTQTTATDTEGGFEVWADIGAARLYERGMMRDDRNDCPVCLVRKRAEDEEEVNAVVADHRRRYGPRSDLMSTFTLRHTKANTLEEAHVVGIGAFRRMIGGSPWERFEKKWGLVGMAKALDYTVNDQTSGWHFHLHVAMGFARPSRSRSDEDVAVSIARALSGVTPNDTDAEIEAELRVMWRRAVKAIDPSFEPVDAFGGDSHAVVVSHPPKANYILPKLGIGGELTSATKKSGKCGSRTPLKVLQDFGEFRRPRDMLLWLEYADAVTGRNTVTYHGAWKPLPPLPPTGDEPPPLPDEKVFTADDWTLHRVRDIPGGIPSIFEAGERAIRFVTVDDRKAKLDACVAAVRARVEELMKNAPPADVVQMRRERMRC